MEKIKNKKSLIAILALAMIGVVGGTIAFFTSTGTFDNIFETADFKAEFSEKFESPDDWTPGQTVEKVVNVRNASDISMAVVVQYEESWTSKNGKELSLEFNNERIVQFTPSSDWTKVEGATNTYYLSYALSPNENINFIENVTLNENLSDEEGKGIICTTTYYDKDDNEIPDPESENAPKVARTSKSCESDGNGYTGAKYELNITITTLQYSEDTYVDAVQNIIGNYPVSISPNKQ